jgi:hypothetical protein
MPVLPYRAAQILMKHHLRVGAVVYLVCSTCLFAQPNPSSTMHSYRYGLSMRSQDREFANEISPTLGLGGTHYYEVETDVQGRTTRAAVIRNGQKLSELSYRFAVGAKLPNEYDYFVAGEKTGVVRIHRDEAGNRIREDHLTVDGTLTHYAIYSYSPDHVEVSDYAANGKKTHLAFLYYSTRGALTDIHHFDSPDPLNYVDIEVDEGTGHHKSGQGFKNGALNDTSSYMYNLDDDLVRKDFYDAKHKWYAAEEFSDGFRARRIDLVGGVTRELQYAYDEKRWLKESALYYKGILVCRLVYDRLPDGAVKQTRAVGPNGEPWAEYPDREITAVKINGEATAGESVIHKTGDWWPRRGDGAPAEILTDTMGVDFGPYITRMLQVIKQNWIGLLPPTAYPPIWKAGNDSIEFTILKNGKVTGMVSHSGSGSIDLDRAAWGSIIESDPLPPLPTEFHGPNLGLRVNFYLNLDRDPTNIVVVPGQEVEVAAGARQKFSVTVPGSTDSKVIWSIRGSGCKADGCGMIAADGAYSAPLNVPSPTIVTVVATLAADPLKTGLATVKIQPSPSQ